MKELVDPHHKFVEDYGSLVKVIEGLRLLQCQIVLTVGTWDMLHIGHLRYLEKAKSQGDILIVGVDTDEVVKQCKGTLRPIVPFKERCEMLTYQSCVDLVSPLDDLDCKGNWKYGLVRRVKPDVFVAEETSYSDNQLADIQKHCGKLEVLPRQALGTSTSLMVQETVKKHIEEMYKLATKR